MAGTPPTEFSSMMRGHIVVALVALLAGLAQDLPSSPVQDSQQRTAPTLSGAAIVGDSAYIALTAQNRLMKENQQNLLETVYWSLGTLVVIAGLLMGFSWYTNFRVYERDKLVLKQDLQAMLVEEINKRFVSISETYSGLQKEIGERAVIHEKRIAEIGAQEAKLVQSRLDSAIESQRHEIGKLRLDVLEHEADNWLARKVPNNELRAMIRTIRIAQEIDYDFFVARSLDRIKGCMQRGANPNADLASELVSMLDGLPSKYSSDVEAIKAALLDSRR
jgi:hypothetical protein